jgi:hypothetical protein
MKKKVKIDKETSTLLVGVNLLQLSSQGNEDTSVGLQLCVDF